MTQDDVIRMAREAGFRTGKINVSNGESLPFIATVSGTNCMGEVMRLIELVAAQEREACEAACKKVASVCEVQQEGCFVDEMVYAEIAANECAAKIRARGNT